MVSAYVRIWLAASLLVACYKPDLQEGRPCSASGECPGDLICADQVCVSTPGGGQDAGDDDAAGDDAGPNVIECGDPERFGDPFTEPAFWLGPFPEAADITFVGGTVTLNVPAGPNFASLTSRFSAHLVGARVFAEILGSDPGITVAFGVAGPLTVAKMRRSDTLLSGEIVNNSGMILSSNSVTYSEVDHRFVGVREEGGTLFLEASADAVNWQVIHSTVAEEVGADVAVRFEASSGTGVAAGSAQFANLNNNDTFGPGCAYSAISEGFELPLLSTALEEFFFDCEVVPDLATGTLVFDLDELAMQPVCAISSRYVHDLTADAATIQVLQPPPATDGTIVGLELEFAGGVYLVSALNGMLRAEVCPQRNCTLLTSIAFDPDLPLFWRISESDGTLSFETSTDGASFTAFVTTPTPFAVTAGRLNFFAVGNAPMTRDIRIDNLNLPAL